MKVSIAYLPEEEKNAGLLLSFIRGLQPGVRVHKNDRCTPYIHLYMTTKKPTNTTDCKEDA
ncbi:MAG: hypothetical protein GXW99_06940 [Clostridiales bacterium]|nr:hypothetical protein [Clostridiales bacterium]